MPLLLPSNLTQECKDPLKLPDTSGEWMYKILTANAENQLECKRQVTYLIKAVDVYNESINK